MNKFLKTRARRVSCSVISFFAAFMMSCYLAYRKESDSNVLISDAEMATRLLFFPCAVAVFVLAFTSLATARSLQPKNISHTAPATNSTKPFVAQVVGLQWLNPLQRVDYPIEWQLLWTMGLVSPNQDDEKVAENPKKYRRIGPVSHIGNANDGATNFSGFHLHYLEELINKHRDIYFSNANYFYNAHSLEDKSTWRELAGIHVEYALPAGKLDRIEAEELTRETIISSFDIGLASFPNAWTRNTPPDVRITMGGANAGFTSLAAGLTYLQENPSQTVWVMNWDAPSFPRDTQLDENMVLLILAGPDFKTGRAPLAWLSQPATSKITEFETKSGLPSRLVQAWKATFSKAAFNAGKQIAEIGFVIHDANTTPPKSSDRLAPLAQTITEELPELDFMKQTFNTPALLGEMGAGSALTNVALGIAYANHVGKTVLIAGTTDPDQTTATVVIPPAIVRPIIPDEPWFRARSSVHTRLPWWGVRHDAKAREPGWSR